MEIVLELVISRKLVLSVEFCREGNEQFCPKQKVIAVDSYGGLAEHIVVDGRFASNFRLNLTRQNQLL